MLEKGRWYRNPGGGVLFVEKVGFSTAEVVIYNGKVRHGVEHARMTGVLDVPKHLVEHALARLPEGWTNSEFHKIEER